MRHRARSDPNHRELVLAFKQFGFAVRTTKWPADAVVARGGRMCFVEFKRDRKARLTVDQKELQADGFPLVVVCSVEDVSRLAQRWFMGCTGSQPWASAREER